MYRIDGIKVPITREITASDIAKRTKLKKEKIISFKILRKAIDARKKQEICHVYTVLADIDAQIKDFPKYKEEEYLFPLLKGMPKKRLLIVGTGPCGLFAGLMLARAGAKPILIERGADIKTRKKAVESFWESGELCSKTNVQFGEGGAGTFSDGKLNSGINDKRCHFVLKTFNEFGAPEEITYSAKPHIGTDILAVVVENMRNEIISLGGEVRFLNKLTKILLEDGKISGAIIENEDGEYTQKTDDIILAIGHSARDTYKMLKEIGVPMEKKNFSLGVRIEHLQEMINQSQYGDAAKYLPPADYKLSAHLKNGRSAYTFCMCPGGFVVASASEEETCVTNGMSMSDRAGKNANSALLVGISPDDFPDEDVLAGVELQRKIEEKAYILGGKNYYAPAMYVGDFIGSEIKDKVEPTYKPGVSFCDISELFPDYITETLRIAIAMFDKKIKGFASGGALLTAPETRSSSPVRILRDNDTKASSLSGLYPAGEGAGYAGGIMSSAVDGIRVAEALIMKYNQEENQ